MEEQIEVSSVDCRRWAADINERLADIRVREGEETYRFMMVTAWLMLSFATQLETDAFDSHPADSELH